MPSVKDTTTYFTAWMLDGADIKWDVIKWDCTWGRFKEEHGSLVWVDYLTSKWEMWNWLSGVQEGSLYRTEDINTRAISIYRYLKPWHGMRSPEKYKKKTEPRTKHFNFKRRQLKDRMSKAI